MALLASIILHAGALLGIGLLPATPQPAQGQTLYRMQYHPAPPLPSGEPNVLRTAPRSLGDRALAPEAGDQPPVKHPLPPPSQTLQPKGAPSVTALSKGTAIDAGSKKAPPEPSGARPFRLYPSDQQLAHWNRKQREHRLRAQSESASSSPPSKDATAAYISSWLAKVQRVGRMNYPEEARKRGITGRVRVLARIRPDGSLIEVRILESSGNRFLDSGAKAIIRLAAPFSPFPASVRVHHPQQLLIRHYCHFTESGNGHSAHLE